MFVNIKRSVEYYGHKNKLVSYYDNKKKEYIDSKLLYMLMDELYISESALSKKINKKNGQIFSESDFNKIIELFNNNKIGSKYDADKSILFLDISEMYVNIPKNIYSETLNTEYKKFLDIILRGESYIQKIQNPKKYRKYSLLKSEVGQRDFGKEIKNRLNTEDEKETLEKFDNVLQLLNISKESYLNKNIYNITSLNKPLDNEYSIINEKTKMRSVFMKEDIMDINYVIDGNDYCNQLYSKAEAYFLKQKYECELSRLEHLLVYIINKDITEEELREYTKKNENECIIENVKQLKKEIDKLRDLICACQIIDNANKEIFENIIINKTVKDSIKYFSLNLKDYEKFYDDKGICLLENIYNANILDDILNIYDYEELKLPKQNKRSGNSVF